MADINCSWDHPGVNPYRGGVPAAVARYNLPKNVEYELIEKARQVRPDSVLTITKSGAISAAGDQFELTNMHYGKKTMCKGDVKRDAWLPNHEEVALVYCAKGTCIAVPLICHNVTLLRPVTQQRDIPRISDSDWLRNRQGPGKKDEEDKDKPRSIPEPSTLLLVAAALLILKLRMKRKLVKM